MVDRVAGVKVEAPPIEPPATPDKHGVALLAIGFFVALASMLFFAIIADRIYNQEAFALDTFANPFLHSVASPTLDFVMNGITSLGSVPVVGLLLVIAIVVLLYRRMRAEALFLLVAIGGSVALNGTLKLVVERPRPALPWAHVLPDYSFPSGHSMNSFVFYLAIAIIVWVIFGRRAGSIAVAVGLLIAFAVGFSRVYLGYHYPSDVIGGYAAGLAWLFMVALAFETLPRGWARTPWGQRSADRRRSQPPAT
jgi:membrane-associated phospholipid phosphatase